PSTPIAGTTRLRGVRTSPRRSGKAGEVEPPQISQGTPSGAASKPRAARTSARAAAKQRPPTETDQLDASVPIKATVKPPAIRASPRIAARASGPAPPALELETPSKPTSKPRTVKTSVKKAPKQGAPPRPSTACKPPRAAKGSASAAAEPAEPPVRRTSRRRRAPTDLACPALPPLAGSRKDSELEAEDSRDAPALSRRKRAEESKDSATAESGSGSSAKKAKVTVPVRATEPQPEGGSGSDGDHGHNSSSESETEQDGPIHEVAGKRQPGKGIQGSGWVIDGSSTTEDTVPECFRMIKGLDSGFSQPKYIDYQTRGQFRGARLKLSGAQADDGAALLVKSCGEANLNTERARKTRVPKDTSAGKGWFGMEQANMTEKLKQDLSVIKMRNYLDSKRFYKKADVSSKFVQLGTVVEGAAEWKSSRLTKKQRKSTLVDELLADQKFKDYSKAQFNKLQEQKQKG
ncbi:unnamed protein product, partial [Chrysoparadoxa australica]